MPTATNKKSAEKILSVILLGVGNIEIDKVIFQSCYNYIDASMRFVWMYQLEIKCIC